MCKQHFTVLVTEGGTNIKYLTYSFINRDTKYKELGNN